MLINSFLLVILCQFGYFWQLLVTLTAVFLLYYMSIVIIFSLQYPDRYVEIVKTGMDCIRSIFNVCYEDLPEKDEDEDEEKDEDEYEEEDEYEYEEGEYEEYDESSEQIVISDCKQYYTYNGIHYDIAFPLFWVLFEHPNRGPHNCRNCSEYGSVRGVFIMYCINCAQEYNEEGYHVGYGAEDNGIEIVTGDFNKAAYMTYLKNRELAYIGLPEEKEKVELNREGYEYVICEEYDQDGDVIKLYPDFKQILQERSDEEDQEDKNDQEDDYDILLEHEHNRDF